MSVLAQQIEAIDAMQTIELRGAVTALRGLSLLVEDLPLPIGALVRIESPGSSRPVRGEVVAFDGEATVVMLFDESAGIAPGAVVIGEQSAQTCQVGRALLGRVVDGLGRPMDGLGPISDTVARLLMPPPTSALKRTPITEPLPTGVRVIDAMTTVGRGQRVGVFAGPGIGKSTLLATIARSTTADVNVIALIGERGREVREFIENTLGEGGLARSVLIVATSDESPLLRVRAAWVACTIAEYFRELGAHGLLMMDSITRFAQAQRQIGLTVGEPPATKGYPPSVFALMPRLLERAGAVDGLGSTTGLYSVLVEGDELSEPISDAARGLLDGHVALSRKLASRGHFPAVDVLESISRVADTVCDQHHASARRMLRRLLAAYAEAEELITIGAYAKGSSVACDVAIDMKGVIDDFLQQGSDDTAAYPEVCRRLIELAAEAEARWSRHPGAMARGDA